jgi:hypothetical protein
MGRGGTRYMQIIKPDEEIPPDNSNVHKYMVKTKQFMFPDDLKVFQEMGANLKLARKSRRLKACDVALYQIEKGNPAVAVGSWYMVMKVLGFNEDFEKIAADDQVGKAIRDYLESDKHLDVCWGDVIKVN